MLRRLIDRPVAVTMGLIVIMVLGVVSIRLLPISLIPDIAVPEITVRVSAPDMSSREVDETVLRPLRQNLIQTSYVNDIVCEARDGSGVISMTFSESADMDYAFIEVNALHGGCQRHRTSQGDKIQRVGYSGILSESDSEE